MVELYHGEPNGVFLKPLIALEEKGIAFTSRYFDPVSFVQHGADFAQNTESRLQLEREGPVLVHDGEVLSSSFFMLEYIAEAFPGVDLKPGGAYEHYQAHAIGQMLALVVGVSVSALGCAKYLAPRLAKLDASALQASIARIEPIERRNAWVAVIDGSCAATAFRERLKPAVKRIEDRLTQSTWLTGQMYSIADIDAFAMLAPIADLAPEVVNERATPRIVEFLRRMNERPAVKAALARSRTGKPQEAFVPSTEPARWG